MVLKTKTLSNIIPIPVKKYEILIIDTQMA